MKAIKLFLLILFCCCSIQVIYSQGKPEWLPDSLATQIPLFRKRVDEWKMQTVKDPTNEKAWLRYSQLVGILRSLSPGEAVEKEFGEMLSKVKQNIPNTATCAMIQYMCGNREQREMTVKDIMKKWPDAFLFYPMYMSEVLMDSDQLKNLSIRWFRSGTFPAESLNFAYNLLASAEQDALIFTNPSTDMHGCFIMQYGKGMFMDKRVIVAPLLFTPTYMDHITDELNIPKYAEDSLEFGKPISNLESFPIMIRKRIDYIIKHTDRPAYLSITSDEPLKKVFGNSLHTEGLLMKYTDKAYDNLAIMRRNFEDTYLLDYLRQSFYPKSNVVSLIDTDASDVLNLYYIPAFKSLLQFYKESDDQTHYDKLYQLLESIVKNAKCDEGIREKYLKSINFQ